MSRIYDKPIVIQKIDESTESWNDLYNLHAKINKASSNNEYLSGGAVQDKASYIFEVRYFADLEDINLNTQLYRIMYKGTPYDIADYDDYHLQHKTVKLLGVSY